MTTSKPPRVKPLYWRVGEGKWHEDPAMTCTPPRPMIEREVLRVINGTWAAWSECGKHINVTHDMTFRRSAPPVAHQCKACRRAKAARKKVKP